MDYFSGNVAVAIGLGEGSMGSTMGFDYIVVGGVYRFDQRV